MVHGAAFVLMAFVLQRGKRLREEAADGEDGGARKAERMEGAAEARRVSATQQHEVATGAFDLCSALPPDMQWVLCGYLGPADLYRACLVSTQWLSVFGNDRVWTARYCSEFNNHGMPLSTLYLKESWTTSVMSMFSFRSKLEAVCDVPSPDPQVLARRWASCGFGVEHLPKLGQLIEAEGPIESDCCMSLRLLTPLAPVISEQLMWRQRAAGMLQCVSPLVQRSIESLRYFRYDNVECPVFEEGNHFSTDVSFACEIGAAKILCRFAEADSDDDIDFPRFSFTNVATEHTYTCTLYPEDVWKEDMEDGHGHPLRQFEAFRCSLALSKPDALQVIAMLLTAVRRLNCIGPLEEVRYEDVECSDCGHVHLS